MIRCALVLLVVTVLAVAPLVEVSIEPREPEHGPLMDPDG